VVLFFEVGVMATVLISIDNIYVGFIEYSPFSCFAAVSGTCGPEDFSMLTASPPLSFPNGNGAFLMFSAVVGFLSILGSNQMK